MAGLVLVTGIVLVALSLVAWWLTGRLAAMEYSLLMAVSVLGEAVRPTIPDPPSDAESWQAVREACAACGLNRDTLTAQTDLVRAGKLHEVLAHASKALGRDMPLRTAGDLVRYLERLES